MKRHTAEYESLQETLPTGMPVGLAYINTAKVRAQTHAHARVHKHTQSALPVSVCDVRVCVCVCVCVYVWTACVQQAQSFQSLLGRCSRPDKLSVCVRACVCVCVCVQHCRSIVC